MRLNIAVVEDDSAESMRLIAFIRNWFGIHDSNELGTLKSYPNGIETVKDFRPGSFHIVFMDIIMEGLNGIETARLLRQLDSRLLIVFTTTSRDYAFDTFPLHPFDYLVKPYNQKDINSLFDEIIRFLSADEAVITLKVRHSEQKLRLSSISSVVSDDHNVNIFTDDGKCITVPMKFSDAEKLFACDSRFIQCNRGIIINMSRVSAVKLGSFVMKEGHVYPMRVRSRTKLEEIFSQYLISQMRNLGGGIKF